MDEVRTNKQPCHESGVTDTLNPEGADTFKCTVVSSRPRSCVSGIKLLEELLLESRIRQASPACSCRSQPPTGAVCSPQQLDVSERRRGPARTLSQCFGKQETVKCHRLSSASCWLRETSKHREISSPRSSLCHDDNLVLRMCIGVFQAETMTDIPGHSKVRDIERQLATRLLGEVRQVPSFWGGIQHTDTTTVGVDP